MSRTLKNVIIILVCLGNILPDVASAGFLQEEWYRLRSRENMKIGNYAAAIEAYEKYLELQPDDREALKGIAQAYEKQGQTDNCGQRTTGHNIFGSSGSSVLPYGKKWPLETSPIFDACRIRVGRKSRMRVSEGLRSAILSPALLHMQFASGIPGHKHNGKKMEAFLAESRIGYSSGTEKCFHSPLRKPAISSRLMEVKFCST